MPSAEQINQWYREFRKAKSREIMDPTELVDMVRLLRRELAVFGDRPELAAADALIARWSSVAAGKDPSPKVVNVNERLQSLSAIQSMAAVLRCVLIYHTPTWTDELRDEWARLSDGEPCYSKNLCDMIRETLRELGFEDWATGG